MPRASSPNWSAWIAGSGSRAVEPSAGVIPTSAAGGRDDRAALAQEVEQVVGDVAGDVERDQRVAEAREVLPRGLGVAAACDPGGDRQQRDRGADRDREGRREDQRPCW